jgi:hypothetical protein
MAHLLVEVIHLICPDLTRFYSINLAYNINALSPKTLAYLVRDLEESEADWQYYPESAPPAAIQQALRQTVATLRAMGAVQAGAEGLDFAQLLDQAVADQQQEAWTSQRNRQVQQNWLSDLE